MRRVLFWILGLSLAVRLFFLFDWHEVWWDEAVYLGMGKFIFSGGVSGLFEHIRPLFVPFLLGLWWKLGLPALFVGRLFEIVLAVASTYLVFVLSRDWFGERVAVISSLLFGLSPIFVFLSFHSYTEIPSVFFILLSLFFFSRERFVLSGVSVGFAFLTKFPAGLFFAILALVLVSRRSFKQLLYLSSGFSVVVPYFLWSWFVYGSPLATVLAASDAISRALGCNVLRFNEWWFYFDVLVSSESRLYWLAPLGLIPLFAIWRSKLLYVFSLVIPLIYFSQLNCRDYRYLVLMLPFVAILAALGVVWLFDKLTKRHWLFIILTALIAVWCSVVAVNFHSANNVELSHPAEQFFSFVSFADGEIWTGNPVVSAYSDVRLNMMYYPIYDAGLSVDFADYVSNNSDRISFILLDNCGGGIICAPGDVACEFETANLLSLLDSRFERVYDVSSGRCWYRIWG